MMSSSDSSMSSLASPGRISTASPAAFLRLKIGTRLQVRRGNHVVPETGPLARAPLWARRSGCWAPSWGKRGTAERIDPTQTLRPWIVGGIPLVSGRHRGREQLDSTGTPCARSAASRPATSLVTETACRRRRSGAVGSLGWCCRPVGQCLAALLSQEVQKKCDEFLLGDSDLRFAERKQVFFLETRQILVNTVQQIQQLWRWKIKHICDD